MECTRFSRAVLIAIALLAGFTCRTAAAESICDPAYQDCKAKLLSYIGNERGGIDVAMWFMEDPDMANALIARHNAGVPVRALVDPRRNDLTPMNATILDMLQKAGIPMRAKSGGGILHWKFMIFSGQNLVQFSAANYSDYYFKPVTPYLDYTDEGIYFCDDDAIVDSFRRKFDNSWVDTTTFANYANIGGTPVRSYPLFAVDPALNFVPAQDFGKRSVPLYDAETQRIDVIMYKITEPTHADGMIRAVRRGVPVRLITEPDLYRNKNNVWQAYHVDRMYAAGVKVRVRAHRGFLHEKTTLLYAQALTIFGSSNWTADSNRVQYEHNYFTTKSAFFTWFKGNFVRKWTNSTGNAETKPFVPLPPDIPVYVAPAQGATALATSSSVVLSWKPGAWAHKADVYFGTSSTPPLFAANVSVSPNVTKSYSLPLLAARTTYYWRIVSKTAAGKTASGAVRSFTTGS
jgi:phosphatidylserine/phosphatidylglycerophosphate/cardiolipin synthase-like enzyme